MGTRHDGPSGIGAKLNDAVQWTTAAIGTVTTSTASTSVPPPMPTDAVSIEAIKLVVTSNKKISLVMGSSGMSHLSLIHI